MQNYTENEFKKEISNFNRSASLYFYQDSHGHEVDLVIDTGTNLLPIEIKSASTYNHAFFKNIAYWHRYLDEKAKYYVIYGETILKLFPALN